MVGVSDYLVSAGEATLGVGLLAASTVDGPVALGSFPLGLAASLQGAYGLANADIAIHNALFDVNNPGVAEFLGGKIGNVVGGENGHDAGEFAGRMFDTFGAFRPADWSLGAAKLIPQLLDNVRVIRDASADSGADQQCH